MKNYIFYILLIFLFACQHKEVDFEEPECNSEFTPYALYSNLYNDLEDENNIWDYKTYYAVCTDGIFIYPVKYDNYTSLYFKPNTVLEKSYIRVSEKEFNEDEYPDISDIRFDSLIVIENITGRPKLIDLYSKSIKLNNPITLEAGVNLYFHTSTYMHNVSIYDIGIYKVNPNTKKVISKVNNCENKIIDIAGIKSLCGKIFAPITEMGTYVVAVPESKANQPKVKGGWINATQTILNNDTTIYYTSSNYNGATYINKVGQEAYTVLVQELFVNGTDINGRAQIQFEGNTTGTYMLNENNKATFSYIKSGELKIFSTTGNAGKIIITKYEPVGGVIEGSIEMNTDDGGINNDGENVIITANFSLKHRIPWSYESN